MAAPSRTLRFKLLIGFTVGVVVLWSIGWFVVATIVDRHADRVELMAASDNLQLQCEERRITGFPFRIELRCSEGSFAQGLQGRVNLEGLTVASLIYKPSQIIAEVAGPLELATAVGPVLRSDWELAHASARLDLDAQAATRIDAEILDGIVRLASGFETAVRDFDVNLRLDPEMPEDLQFALRMMGLRPVAGGPAADVSIRGRVAGGADLLALPDVPQAWDVDETPVAVTVDSARFRSGDMVLEATAALTANQLGELSGTVDIFLTGYEDGIPYVAAVAPDAGEQIDALLIQTMAFAPEAESNGRNGRKITVTLKDGRPFLGLVPLPYKVPPLPFLAW